VLRHLFGLETYAIVQLAALLLFGPLAVALCCRAGFRLRHATALTLLYLVCNFLVAKVLFDYVKAGGRQTFWQHPALAHFLEGGYWDWPLALLACALLYPFALRLAPVPSYRVVAFLLPPVLAVQKLGCFAAGCCFGCETKMPWAVVFPEDSLCETPVVPVHPLQLYDAALPLAVLGVLVVVDRCGAEPVRPLLLPVIVGLHALARFGTEFLRPHEPGQVLLLSQWLELGALLAVVLVLNLGRGAWRRLARGRGRAAAVR
jgi:phosphatidylglycerol:prolipoprotein diacylglycerol transferase